MKLEERHYAETAREYARRMLKENIISMDLKPGAMVSENELAAQLGLSRTPVREALMDMSQYGVVDVMLGFAAANCIVLEGMTIHFDRVRALALTVVKDQKVIDDHRQICDAIERRDVAAAQEIMTKHLTRVKVDEASIRQACPEYIKT